jgi:hypothetical protein
MTAPIAHDTDRYDAPTWRHSASVFDTPLMPPPPSIPILISDPRGRGVMNVISAKILMLRGLRDGWTGPGSVAPDVGAVHNFDAFLAALGPAATLRAEPVAADDGSVEIEWKLPDGAERAIEFTADGMWLFESRGGEVREETLDHFDLARAVNFFHGEPI